MRRKFKTIDIRVHLEDLVSRLGGVSRAANYAGLDKSYVSRLVRGEREITLEICGKFENAVREHERRVGCHVKKPLRTVPRRPKSCV
jgi:hypothetical protein